MMTSKNEPLDYFKEISAIPRGSGNTEKIRSYIREFAAGQKLPYYEDAAGNIIIKKQASPGLESKDPVIIQGHMDMVAVKDDNIDKDLLKDPVELVIEDGIISAKGTSLGADDGIAVAYMLSLLSKNDIKHPPLECLFTNDEEIGLLGAANADYTQLMGKKLINLDSEEEGELVCGCAGGIRSDAVFDITREKVEGFVFDISLSGLTGGHSGIMIHKGRGNANVLMARVVSNLLREGGNLVSFNGGTRDNVIATIATATLFYADDKTVFITERIKKLDKILKNEYSVTDPGIKLELINKTKGSCDAISKNDSEKFLTFIRMSPNGCLNMNSNIPDLVETSANTGIVKTHPDRVSITHLIRSSVDSRKADLCERTRDFAGLLGGKCSFSGDYPAWEYRKDSPLRDTMVSLYKKMFDHPMKVTTIHAGLECGYFSSKIKDLDCVSIGPKLKDVHSTKESVSIHSINNVWRYLLKVLESI